MRCSYKDHWHRCCIQIKTAVFWGSLQSIVKNSGHFTCRYWVPPCTESLSSPNSAIFVGSVPKMTLKGLILYSGTLLSGLDMLHFIMEQHWICYFSLKDPYCLAPRAVVGGLVCCAEKGKPIVLVATKRLVPEVAVAKISALKSQRKRVCLHGPAILYKLFRLAVLMVSKRTEVLQTTAVVCCSAWSLQWQDGGLCCQGLTPVKDKVFVFAAAPRQPYSLPTNSPWSGYRMLFPWT